MDRHSSEAQNSGQQTEYIPHSGVNGIETPVNDYDNTTLPEAVERGLVEVPESVPTELSSPQTQTQESEKPAKKKLSLGAKIGAGAAGLLIAGGAAFGISQLAGGQEGDNTPPEKDPNDNSQVEEEPAPVEEEPAAPEKSPLEIRSEELAEMSWEEYKTVSREDMLLHTDNLLKKTYDETAQSYESNGEKVYFELFNPIDIASEDNSGEEVLNQYWYTNQVAMAQRGGDGTTTALDKVEAKKALTGAYYYSGDEPFVMGAYNGMMRWVNESSDTAMLSSRYTFISETPLTEGVDSNGEPVIRKDIVFKTTTTGEEENIGRFAYVEYTNKNGETKGRWMPMVVTKADTPEILDLHD